MKEIEVGTRIIYVSASGFLSWTPTSSSTRRGRATTKPSATAHSISSPVLDCALFLAGPASHHIRMSATVTQLPGNNGEDWAWDGTYSFNPRD